MFEDGAEVTDGATSGFWNNLISCVSTWHALSSTCFVPGARDPLGAEISRSGKWLNEQENSEDQVQ